MRTWQFVAAIDGKVEAETRERAKQKIEGMVDGNLTVKISDLWEEEVDLLDGVDFVQDFYDHQGTGIDPLESVDFVVDGDEA